MAEHEDAPTTADLVQGLDIAEIEKAVSHTLAVDHGKPGGPIHYPSNLNSQIAKGREYMRFRIISRDHTEKKSIYLLTPPGLTVPDGASWNNVDLGTLVGGGISVAKKGAAAVKNLASGNAQSFGGIEDLIAASTLTAIEKFSPTLLGTKGMMTAGLTANPYTNTQFAGTNLRTFEFAFKMIAESQGEAKTAKDIENCFRKFLYPRTHPKSDMVLIYPPLWEITFWKNKDANTPGRNTFMPMIHLCNLGSMNVVFNATGNSFHDDGSPTEIDMSLSFMESKTLTRDDLYGKSGVPNYNQLDYNFDMMYPKDTDGNLPAAAEGLDQVYDYGQVSE